MPDRILKPALEKDDIPTVSPEEFLQVLERADVYLPVSTEVSPVSPESRVVMHTDPRSAGADRSDWCRYASRAYRLRGS